MLPVVLVHGLIGTLGEATIVDGFAPRTAVAPDLLGYGEHAGVAPSRIHVDAQVSHLEGVIDEMGWERFHVVGHSVGAVVSALLIARRPDRIAGFVNVEGNFTLADAFWSRRFAALSPGDAEGELVRKRGAPAEWLRDSDVSVDAYSTSTATRWLARQPASTIQSMARSVVQLTDRAEYRRILREVFRRVRVYLVAGERSRASWDVPTWALEAARGVSSIRDAGHLMMLDHPREFVSTIERWIADAELET